MIVEPDELEQISPGRSRTIDIAGFVDLDQIDPIFFDKTYYRGREYQKVYKLLVETLGHAGKAGLAMFAIRAARSTSPPSTPRTASSS
ncbi:Ku protein [Kitasatospora sp. NPDC004240]